MKTTRGFWMAVVGMAVIGSGWATWAQLQSGGGQSAGEVIEAARAQAALDPIEEKTIPAFTFAPSSPPGTYWMLQNDSPPLPFDPFPELMIYALGDGAWLVDDRSVDWPALQAQLQAVELGTEASPGGLTSLTTSNSVLLPPPDDGGGGGDDGGTNGPATDGWSSWQDAPTNMLWISIGTVTNGWAPLALHGTEPDRVYEVLSKVTLTNVPWISEGTVLGAPETNYTPTTIAVGDRTNTLFFWARSWVDSDGSGLPDWWQLQYFGHLGVDPYGDPDGDGWPNLQEYQNGTNPTEFNTPPTPTGLQVSMASNGVIATVRWLPSSGPVTGYTIERSFTNQVIQISVSATQATDTTAALPAWLYQESEAPQYRLRAEYAGGSGAWTTWLMPPECRSPIVQTVSDSAGRLFFAASGLGGSAVLRVGKQVSDGYHQVAATNFDLPIASFTNGLVEAPAGFAAAVGDAQIFARSLTSNGVPSAKTTMVDRAPFFDARIHLHENLHFLLRSATVSRPFSYVSSVTAMTGPELPGVYFGRPESPPDYECSGFHNYFSLFDEVVRRELRPVEENHLWRNFVFNSVDVSNGVFTTGAEFDWNNGGSRTLSNPKYFYAGSGTEHPLPMALQNTNSTWTLSFWTYNDDDYDLSDLGLFLVENPPGTFSVFLASNTRNVYGLSINSVLFQDANNSQYTNVLAGGPGGQAKFVSFYFAGVSDPVLQTVDYYFVSPTPYVPQIPDYPPQPGTPNFSVTNSSPTLIAPIGELYRVSGWAKQAILNGFSNKFAYLEQYFDKAYTMTNGVATTNQTGVLSAYGEFFPTEPGPTALVTMPDLDAGARGTAVVHVVKLQLDVNHDSVMDLSFNGPDNTSQAKPFVFWVNNDCDWATYPGSPNFDPGSDKELTLRYSDQFLKDYLNFNPRSVRDLEDYARLWICGVPALTNGNYSVTLNWANVSGSPAINLLRSVEPDGGTRYLTDANIVGTSNIVWQQIDGFIGGHKYNVPTTSTLTLPNAWFTNADNKYLLFEGAGIGSGELVLTISQNGTNVLARTSAWFDLRDVRDLYERVVVTNTTTGGITNWSSAIQTIEYPKVSMDDDTNIIVFVHGINNTVPNWLISSDTIFKRLYWAGYRGKFATVKWPCKYLPPKTHPFDFNLSEFYGYKSGAALRDYLNQLRQVRFPSHQLHIYAHSQGAAVASDAISQYGAPFDTLILSQAAMPASCYDAQAPTLQKLLDAESLEPTPQWRPMGYRGIYTNITGRVVNFYNAEDYALATGTFALLQANWEQNQKVAKPDGLAGARNYVSDGTNGFAVIDVGLYRLVTDSAECRGMVARSRTKAVGALVGVGGVVDVGLDLQASYGFSDTRSDHSAQFARPIQSVYPYYQQILIQIQPPQ